MRLLIVGKPVGRGIAEERLKYRGTYRDRPYYCDQFSEDHEVNKAFFWFIQNGREGADNELDVVFDLRRAKALAAVYKRYTDQEFEVVEVTSGAESPSAGKQFLGYD